MGMVLSPFGSYDLEKLIGRELFFQRGGSYTFLGVIVT